MEYEYSESILVALGSNLRDGFASCEALLEAALECFPRVGLTVLKRSRWWRSTSWPDPSAPDYLNGLAIVEAAQSPVETLASLHALEEVFGRRRTVGNAPRTLDLDLIAHGRVILNDDAITVPHPRAADRLFVMGPLAEIAPRWVHPVLGETAAVLAARAGVGRDARPV